MDAAITVIIPCKNEAANIDACIASARKIAQEVLVADSGSTDGTLEKARQSADRVVEREYVNSGDFKNWAIPQASHEWVVILDADERITNELADEIREVVLFPKNKRKKAYSIKRRNFFLGHPIDHGDWARDEVTRLFRRDDCRYELHTDHAEIDVHGAELGRLKAKMWHYTAWDLNEYLQKMGHYAHQQAELWYENGKRPEWQHVFLNAPLRFAKSYILRAGFRDGVLGFFIATLTAYYSFLKQFALWQLTHARTQAELDGDYAAASRESGIEVDEVSTTKRSAA